MPKFHVYRKEIWIQEYIVEAPNHDEARRKVAEEYHEANGALEYSSTPEEGERIHNTIDSFKKPGE